MGEGAVGVVSLETAVACASGRSSSCDRAPRGRVGGRVCMACAGRESGAWCGRVNRQFDGQTRLGARQATCSPICARQVGWSRCRCRSPRSSARLVQSDGDLSRELFELRLLHLQFRWDVDGSQCNDGFQRGTSLLQAHVFAINVPSRRLLQSTSRRAVLEASRIRRQQRGHRNHLRRLHNLPPSRRQRTTCSTGKMRDHWHARSCGSAAICLMSTFARG